MNIPDSEQKAALFTMVVLSSASRSKGDSINNIVLKINGKDAMLLMIVFRLFHDVRKCETFSKDTSLSFSSSSDSILNECDTFGVRTTEERKQ